MNAAERKKDLSVEGDNDALAELERFASEEKGRSSLPRDREPAREPEIDLSILAEAALRQGGD